MAPNGRSPTSPKWIRSSTRAYPHDEEDVEGLTVEDIDGDGRILQMRIADPNGLWKAHPEEPRLMVRREPAETGGTYYRILPEGSFEDYDGYTLQGQEDDAGARPQPQFPGELAPGVRAAGRRPVSRLPSPKSAPWSTSSRSIRTSPAASRSTPGPACCCGRSITSPTTEMHAEDLWHYQESRRQGHRAHRLSRRSRSITSFATTRSR